MFDLTMTPRVLKLRRVSCHVPKNISSIKMLAITDFISCLVVSTVDYDPMIDIPYIIFFQHKLRNSQSIEIG